MKRIKYLLALLSVVLMAFAFGACGEVDDSPITDEEMSELYTNADSFKGRTFEFTGRVLDVEKDGGTLYLQVYQDIENYENNTIVVYPEADVKIKNDDFVKVNGTIDGSFKGENAFGGEVVAPQVTATSVEKISAAEAANAAAEVKIFLMISSNADGITILYHLAQQQSSCFIYYDNKLKPLNTKKRLTKHKNCGKINYR